ncbi:hypothetical protein RND71_010542 [Anisodus tanguticus]|uniref:CRAL-TRIO domain-containing protein n=1 Tax=Anisodus tanguticus TaxID=243964 RepID=A0AAE1SJR4_9SOLA|nr:hypothetical protein RND71_010542 [Anisodus tanguticus]
MVVVGAHFLLRCLDLERFIIHVVKVHDTCLLKFDLVLTTMGILPENRQPDLGLMKRIQQILGRKHQRNLHEIYVLHPTFGLESAIFALQLFVDNVVWKKVVCVDRLLQLFRYAPREQLTIPVQITDILYERASLKLGNRYSDSYKGSTALSTPVSLIFSSSNMTLSREFVIRDPRKDRDSLRGPTTILCICPKQVRSSVWEAEAAQTKKSLNSSL